MKGKTQLTIPLLWMKDFSLGYHRDSGDVNVFSVSSLAIWSLSQPLWSRLKSLDSYLICLPSAC